MARAGRNGKGEPRRFALGVPTLRGRDLQGLAEWTGLEPATPGVTGRYSNQLNYHSRTLELPNLELPNSGVLVGAEGIEPPTFAL